MNTSQSGWWGSWPLSCTPYARVNYYFRNKVKKMPWTCLSKTVKMTAHPWRKPILTSAHAAAAANWVQGKDTAEGGGEGEEKQKDTKMTQKREFKRFLNILWLFYVRNWRSDAADGVQGKVGGKGKERQQHKKEFKCFWNIFSVFRLVKSFTPARDRRRCRLAGGTYCFLNPKFSSFGWHTGKFGWELNILSNSRNIFIKRQSHPG